MLIPSIDLKGGKVVQLVQGDRPALETDDLEGWIARFRGFPTVQLIDLDAALGTGVHDRLVARVCAALTCQVGGGVRSLERASTLIAAGAKRVIVGSAFFKDGRPDPHFAARLAERIGADRVLAAVDSRAGKVVIHGWRTTLEVTPVEAVRVLEPYCAGFLYTHVDTEGLMRGIDREAVLAVRRATTKLVAAAGGITTREEIEELDRLGIDSVVGMAIYTGRLDLSSPFPSSAAGP